MRDFFLKPKTAQESTKAWIALSGGILKVMTAVIGHISLCAGIQLIYLKSGSLPFYILSRFLIYVISIHYTIVIGYWLNSDNYEPEVPNRPWRNRIYHALSIVMLLAIYHTVSVPVRYTAETIASIDFTGNASETAGPGRISGK